MQVTYDAFAYKGSYQSISDIESGEEMPYVWKHESDAYTKVGTAVVTVTLFSKSELHKNELANLNEKLKTERADSQRRQNAILDQISKLQALTFETS